VQWHTVAASIVEARTEKSRAVAAASIVARLGTEKPRAAVASIVEARDREAVGGGEEDEVEHVIGGGVRDEVPSLLEELQGRSTESEETSMT
jgi:hypothetical protein